MSKPARSKEYASKAADKWALWNAENRADGLKEFELEHMLSIAWRQGFDAGQRHQRILQKEKANEAVV